LRMHPWTQISLAGTIFNGVFYFLLFLGVKSESNQREYYKRWK